MNTVEVRCPVGPQKLFTKLKLGEEFGKYIPTSNSIEFTCSDCAKRMSRGRQQRVRVYHRFNFVGDLVQTIVEDEWECGTAFA